MSFIFGGDTGASYEQVQRQRRIAEAMMAQQGTPRNVGEGISSFARQISGALLGRRAAKRDDELRSQAMEQYGPIINSLFGGGTPSATPAGFTPSPVSTPAVSTQPMMTPEQEVGADTREMLIRTGLIERGLPEHVADAFVMNFRDESNLDPGINEIEPLVPGSRGGFGLAQWTGPRRRQLEAFAAERGAPVSDLNTQLDFLMTELEGPEARAAQSILSSRDAPTAAAAIVNDFLRPAEVNRAKREARYIGGQPAQPAQGSTSPDMRQVIEALSNPYVQQNPGMVMALQSYMQNAMQRPEAGFSILTAEEKAALGLPVEAPLQRGPDGRITQIGGGGTSVTVDMSQPSSLVGQTVQGRDENYIVEADPDAPGGIRLVPVEGGEAAIEAEAAAAAEEEQAAASDTASQVISNAFSRASEADAQRVLRGTLGRLASVVPETANAEVVRQVSVLQDLAAAESLNAMRRQSPTGGALGNVTERELALLSRQAGALDPASPNFQRDLRDYTVALMRTVHGGAEGERIANELFAADDAEAVDTSNMTPEELVEYYANGGN